MGITSILKILSEIDLIKTKRFSGVMDERIEDRMMGDRKKIVGWIRSFRNNKFISINDGSCTECLQLVISDELKDLKAIAHKLTLGASISAEGYVSESKGPGQSHELIVDAIEIIGECLPSKYPFQPRKNPTLEFMRDHVDMRFRTEVFQSIMKVRSHLSAAIHNYLTQDGFTMVSTPIITGNDCEGAGETFKVSAGDDDFFGKPCNLTVSGQLHLELAAIGLGKVYTFGPTFRAENSNTTRHLSEFWMLEAEMAFKDLSGGLSVAIDTLKSVMDYVLDICEPELDIIDAFVSKEEERLPKDQRKKTSIKDKISEVVESDFEIIEYSHAVQLLDGQNKKVKWGQDLNNEHERLLTDRIFRKPVAVINYPKDIKAFYMHQNDDGKTVAAMDILLPGIGEVVGGSQRETRELHLLHRMNQLKMDTNELSWYTKSRELGGVPHSGFGMGFERLVQFCTGMRNIRDVIPFPRAPKECKY